MGVFYSVQQMTKPIKKITVFHSGQGGVSGGTTETMFTIGPLPKEKRDPFLLNPENSITEKQRKLSKDGFEIKFNHAVIRANGYKKVKSADIGELSEDKTEYKNIKKVECDCICVSGFWTPSVHLASQSGNKLKFDAKIDAFIPDKSKQNEKTIGAANGSFTLQETIESGFKTGSELSSKITDKNNDNKIPTVTETKYLSLIHI